VSSREDPVLGLVFRSPEGPLRFFETITTFATPLDVTLDELDICQRLAQSPLQGPDPV
jgi:hypothetical protein